MRAQHETWSAPRLPERGDMHRATVAFDVYTGLAKVDLRYSERYQAAWVLRERAILGTPLNVAWRRLEREHTIPALYDYETLVDKLAPPIDTQEYSPDTAREIRRDAREAVIQSRRNTGNTEMLPPTDNKETSKPVFYLAKQTELCDTLGQSSVDAMHGVTERISRNDAYAIVEQCVVLAKAGDVRSLTNTLRSSREVLSAYGFLGTRDKHTHRWSGVMGAVLQLLPTWDGRKAVLKAVRL